MKAEINTLKDIAFAFAIHFTGHANRCADITALMFTRIIGKKIGLPLPEATVHPITRGLFFAWVTGNCSICWNEVTHAISETNCIRNGYTAKAWRWLQVTHDNGSFPAIRSHIEIVRTKVNPTIAH